MTEFVKQFVEKNIEHIEDEQWLPIFRDWCDEMKHHFYPREAECQLFEELVSVLLQVGAIDIMAANVSRRHAIEEEIDRVTQLVAYLPGAYGTCMPIEQWLKRMSSYLGYKEIQIKHFIITYVSSTYTYDTMRKGFLIT